MNNIMPMFGLVLASSSNFNSSSKREDTPEDLYRHYIFLIGSERFTIEFDKPVRDNYYQSVKVVKKYLVGNKLVIFVDPQDQAKICRQICIPQTGVKTLKRQVLDSNGRPQMIVRGRRVNGKIYGHLTPDLSEDLLDPQTREYYDRLDRTFTLIAPVENMVSKMVWRFPIEFDEEGPNFKIYPKASPYGNFWMADQVLSEAEANELAKLDINKFVILDFRSDVKIINLSSLDEIEWII